MIRLAATVLGGLMLAFAACGGGDDTADDDDSPAASAIPTSGRTTPSATLTAHQLERFTTQAVPGFASSDARTIPIGVTVTFTSEAKTAGGAQVVVVVQVSSCDPFICGSLDPASFSSADAQRSLKSGLPSAHIENPALRWDFGKVTLSASATGLYTYALSYIETRDASGGTTRASVNSYRAWYHDGRTLIAMDVFSRGGDAAQSLAALEMRITKAEAEAAAIKVFTALSPNFSAK